jgi:hypothetical protein
MAHTHYTKIFTPETQIGKTNNLFRAPPPLIFHSSYLHCYIYIYIYIYPLIHWPGLVNNPNFLTKVFYIYIYIYKPLIHWPGLVNNPNSLTKIRKLLAKTMCRKTTKNGCNHFFLRREYSTYLTIMRKDKIR